MDKLIINQFKLDTNIGIYQHEKENKQTLYFNLEVSTCLKKAGKSDNIKDTINYEKIIKVIKKSSTVEVARKSLLSNNKDSGLIFIINKPYLWA